MSAAEGPPTGGASPSEEELRAAYEAELARISATDMIAQAAVSLLNIGARRMGAPGGEGAPAEEGRDLEQARDAIDAARALLEILERRIPRELGPLRDALSRLQMAYAAEIRAGGGGAGEGSAEPEADEAGGGGGAAGQPPGDTSSEPSGRRPGPAESSGRLWVPGQ